MDVGFLVKSILKSSINGQNRFYWDDAEHAELSELITTLSNPEDLERQIVRDMIHLRGASSVLDAACGVATDFKGFEIYGPKVDYVGIDKSAKMLDLSQERYPKAIFVRGDIENLPFKDNSFDVVLLKHALEHLPDYKIAVKEALRVASDIVIVNFFHKMLPFNKDIHLWNKSGYWDNWYSRRKFERFLDEQNVRYRKITTRGTAEQTAEIYILERIK